MWGNTHGSLGAKASALISCSFLTCICVFVLQARGSTQTALSAMTSWVTSAQTAVSRHPSICPYLWGCSCRPWRHPSTLNTCQVSAEKCPHSGGPQWGMSSWFPSVGLLSWCPFFKLKSSHCNGFEDQHM